MRMKEEVLRALGESSGYVSGEEISRAVGKTRTAVWQWIEELRADGYVIDAATRRGYRLVSRPDRIYPWEIARHLDTEFIGKTIHYHEYIGSTNDEAKQVARNGATEGTVIVAEGQVKGRGRRGRSWASPFGAGVWSSTILRPKISPYDAPKVALVSALAVVRAIREVTELDASIKWPNDVLVDGRKVSGILVEMDAELDNVRALVLGIGINANVPQDAFPEDAKESAISLSAAAGRTLDRARLLGRTLTHLEAVYVEWMEKGFDTLLDALRENTATLGREVRVIEAEGEWGGVAVDLAQDGALVVVDDQGARRTVYAAEVTIRPRSES